jgi:hypothetical protein
VGRHLLSRAAGAVTAAAVTAVMAAGLAPPAGASPGAPAGNPASAPVAGAGAGGQLLLITGERLVVPAGGGTGPGMIVPTAQGGPGGPVLALSAGGTGYDLPAVAVPYLGHGLDPRLFEPSALLARERGGRLPVHISYRGRRPALPGITITHSGGGTATGYLTQTSARAFGAALARQHAADRTRASYGTDGIFAAATTITLPGDPPRAASARPEFRMHTLTVKATNLAGRPDTGDDVVLVNVDNSNIAGSVPPTQVFYHGIAKYSVPAGHYFALGIFFQPEGTGRLARLAVLPQFTVSGNDTVTMPEAAADSKITMVTPRPAVPTATDFSIERTAATGPPLWAEFPVLGRHSIWVSPTQAKPTVGTLRSFAGQGLASPPGHGTPYEYTFGHSNSSGTIPVQRYLVRPRDLAAITERLYDPVHLSGEFLVYGILPGTSFNDPAAWFGQVGPGLVRMMSPGRVTAYAGYTGGTSATPMEWHSQFTPAGTIDIWRGDTRVLRPGEHLTEDWADGPLHPAANALLFSEPSVFTAPMPSALRAGNTLRLELDPFDDSQPGHLIGSLRWPTAPKLTGSYQIDQNGTEIAHGNAVPPGRMAEVEFYTKATLSPGPATIRFVLNLARATGSPLSNATSTVWTWRSAPAPGATLPPGWTCLPDTNSRRSDRTCAVQPMVTLAYAVRGLSPSESAPAGHQVVRFTAGHLQLAKAVAVTRAAMSVSFDDGKTWHRAHVTGSDGGYTATFTAPPGAKVSLRTTAADAAGGSITETISNAYRTA